MRALFNQFLSQHYFLIFFNDLSGILTNCERKSACG